MPGLLEISQRFILSYKAKICAFSVLRIVKVLYAQCEASLVGWITFFDPTLSQQIVGFGKINPTDVTNFFTTKESWQNGSKTFKEINGFRR